MAGILWPQTWLLRHFQVFFVGSRRKMCPGWRNLIGLSPFQEDVSSLMAPLLGATWTSRTQWTYLPSILNRYICKHVFLIFSYIKNCCLYVLGFFPQFFPSSLSDSCRVISGKEAIEVRMHVMSISWSQAKSQCVYVAVLKSMGECVYMVFTANQIEGSVLKDAQNH